MNLFDLAGDERTKVQLALRREEPPMVLEKKASTYRMIAAGTFVVLALMISVTAFYKRQSVMRMEQRTQSLQLQVQSLKDQLQNLRDQAQSLKDRSAKSARPNN
jgi:cell division protein FtsL